MGFDPATLGMQTAEAGINTLLGLALEGHQDRRQLKQQGKLLEQQAATDRRQAEFSQALGLETWKKTGPVALSEELEKAGLNKALQYGGSGGGGQTMGMAGANVNAEGAPRGGGEVMGLQLMGAQKALIEAQTAKTQAETAKTAGIDTKLATAQERLARNVAQMYVDTYETTYSKLLDEAGIVNEQYNQMITKSDIMDATKDEEIALKEGELIGLGIANELKKAEMQNLKFSSIGHLKVITGLSI